MLKTWLLPAIHLFTIFDPLCSDIFELDQCLSLSDKCMIRNSSDSWHRMVWNLSCWVSPLFPWFTGECTHYFPPTQNWSKIRQIVLTAIIEEGTCMSPVILRALPHVSLCCITDLLLRLIKSYWYQKPLQTEPCQHTISTFQWIVGKYFKLDRRLNRNI